MIKSNKKSSKRFMNLSKRGASMVEYALLLVCVLIAAAAGYKALKDKVGPSGQQAADSFN
jgi:Flp pilus assembly pilin Flp